MIITPKHDKKFNAKLLNMKTSRFDHVIQCDVREVISWLKSGNDVRMALDIYLQKQYPKFHADLMKLKDDLENLEKELDRSD